MSLQTADAGLLSRGLASGLEVGLDQVLGLILGAGAKAMILKSNSFPDCLFLSVYQSRLRCFTRSSSSWSSENWSWKGAWSMWRSESNDP